jgi:hypothetical protein
MISQKEKDGIVRKKLQTVTIYSGVLISQKRDGITVSFRFPQTQGCVGTFESLEGWEDFKTT